MNYKKLAFILLVLAPSISMAKVNVLDYGAKAAGVTINGCRLQGGERFEIVDEAKKNVQAGLNLTR